MANSSLLRFRRGSGRSDFGRPLALCAFLNALSGGDLILAAPAQPPGQQPISYRLPSREYKAVRLDDMRVSVEKQLQAETPEVASRALNRLKAERAKILALLPARASKQLSRVPFFLMYGPKSKNGGRNNGLDYIQKDGPRFHAELDRRWGDSIVVYCAQNYTDISDLWARKALLHEFAHAYQLEQWPEHQPDIQSAWEHAGDKGLYRNVHDIETGETRESAYAMVNQLEYFAELSAMYFARCNYEPTDRQKLKAYDPVGYAMIRKLWRAEK